MKKVLLGSTALVAAGMLAGSGAPAQGAEPITLSLGGYYQAFFVVRTQDDSGDRKQEGDRSLTSLASPRQGANGDIRHTDVNQEGEVFFSGSTTLDNGITVGVNIQLEAYSRQARGGSNDQIDEHYVFFSGNFGRLVIGAENAAPYAMHYSAPGSVPGHGLDSPNLFTMRGNTGNAAAVGSPVATPVNLTSDANKITYFTPRFSPGFQFGFSYTPDITDFNGSSGSGGGRIISDSDDPGQENLLGFGVNLVRTFGDVDFAWSFGWEHGFVEEQSRDDTTGVRTDSGRSGADQLSTGFQIGIDGWKVGGAFQYSDEGNSVLKDDERYEAVLGVTYGAGPWTVGVMGAYGVDKDGPDKDSDRVVAGEVGGAYTLGPGVKVAAALQGMHTWGDEADEDFDGIALTIGTALSF